jgi:hypothetical protein
VCTCRLDHADPLVVRVSNGFKWISYPGLV